MTVSIYVFLLYEFSYCRRQSNKMSKRVCITDFVKKGPRQELM